MSNVEKGAFNMVHDIVKAAENTVKANAAALEDARKKTDENFETLTKGRLRNVSTLNKQQLLGLASSPNDEFHRFGVPQNEADVVHRNLPIENIEAVYAAHWSDLIVKLLGRIGDKFDGVGVFNGYPGIQQLPYKLALAAASQADQSAALGKIMLQVCLPFIGDADQVKKAIGAIGFYIGAGLVQNKVKLADVEKGMDVLRSIFLLSGFNISGEQPSAEEKETYGTLKALTDAVPVFFKSFEEKGGLKGLVKEVQPANPPAQPQQVIVQKDNSEINKGAKQQDKKPIEAKPTAGGNADSKPATGGNQNQPKPVMKVSKKKWGKK